MRSSALELVANVSRGTLVRPHIVLPFVAHIHKQATRFPTNCYPRRRDVFHISDGFPEDTNSSVEYRENKSVPWRVIRLLKKNKSVWTLTRKAETSGVPATQRRGAPPNAAQASHVSATESATFDGVVSKPAASVRMRFYCEAEECPPALARVDKILQQNRLVVMKGVWRSEPTLSPVRVTERRLLG